MKMWLLFQFTLLWQSTVHSETGKKLNVSCKLFVNNFTLLKELKFSYENMTEEDLKSQLITSDNPCILTFSIASIFRTRPLYPTPPLSKIYSNRVRISLRLYKICICLVILELLKPMRIYQLFNFSKIFDAIKYAENSTFFDVHLSVTDFKAQNLL